MLDKVDLMHGNNIYLRSVKITFPKNGLKRNKILTFAPLLHCNSVTELS